MLNKANSHMRSYYYFAYGSNLNFLDAKSLGFEKIGMYLEFVSIAYLPDHILQFSRFSQRRQCGALDIIPSKGRVVYGVVFKILEDIVWQELDKKECVPTGYRYVEKTIYTENNKKLVAGTYEVAENPADRIKKNYKPSDEYLSSVIKGYRKFSLPTDDLKKTLSRTMLVL